MTGDGDGIPNGVSIPGKNGDVVLSGVVKGVVLTVVVVAILVVGRVWAAVGVVTGVGGVVYATRRKINIQTLFKKIN